MKIYIVRFIGWLQLSSLDAGHEFSRHARSEQRVVRAMLVASKPVAPSGLDSLPYLPTHIAEGLIMGSVGGGSRALVQDLVTFEEELLRLALFIELVELIHQGFDDLDGGFGLDFVGSHPGLVASQGEVARGGEVAVGAVGELDREG